jgi:hypothetical protein
LKETEGAYAQATVHFKASFSKALKYLKQQSHFHRSNKIFTELQKITHCRPIDPP